STTMRHFAMKHDASDSTRTSTERDYGLEKILHRIRCSVWFSFPLWIHLVRDAHAWRASGSPNASTKQTRLPVADFRSHRYGILSYTALCEICPCWRRRRVREAGNFGGVGICWCRSDHVRSTAADHEDPLRLDRWGLGPIRNCGRNHWRDV